MPPPICHDRKRKQGESRSSSIMEGQFTRSKSQIYLHCNRSGRIRVDSARFKRSDHQLRQLDPPVKKPKRVFVQNPEVSSDLCEMSRTPIKDLRARRVFSPAASVVLENAENLKKSELMLFEEKNGVGSELNGEKVDEFGSKKCDETEIEGNGNRGGTGQNLIELSSGNVSIPKSNSVVSLSLRRKVFIAPSSYSYRRLLPYLTDAAREYSDVLEIETRDTSSKFNNPTLSYLKPHLRSTASNGSASLDKHVGANSDVSKTLVSVEGQKVEVNVSCNPQDPNDGLSQNRVEPLVSANVEGLDSKALEECVQNTPPDADIFFKANVRDLGVSVEHNAQQMEKKCAGHPLDSRNGCIVKKSSLNPGKNGSVSRNKLALNPCSSLTKVFKAAGSVSYRRLLPFLMDVAKNDPGGASSENELPQSQRDMECNQPLISVTKEVPRNKEYSLKKDDIKEQETKLPEPNCSLANGVSDHLNTCISTEVSSSATESFNKMPSSVFPDDVVNSQTLLNVDITRKSETQCTDTSNTEKSEPECLNNFNTADFSGVLSSSNVNAETSAGQFNVPNLLPISLEDLLSEYGVEDPKAESVSPEGDRMTLKVDCNEENRNCGDLTGTVGICANASESLKKKLFLKISEPEPINNESSCEVLLADRDGDSGGLDNVALIKVSPSTETSGLSGYDNDDPTKTLCCETVEEISQSEPIGRRRDFLGVDDNLNKNGCLEPAICLLKSTQNESSYDLVTHPDVLNKGILKRNPRGCRGLCNCLNCASFRLHAERAFEFSRNQMQDTEEVSLGLLKELADMRIFLEKRLSTKNGLAPIPLTQLEVEEACSKALEAEQRAKERLSQMNNELTYHCRVPSLYRPRVTFATCNEEKAVAKIESSSSKTEEEDIKAGTKRTRKKLH